MKFKIAAAILAFAGFVATLTGCTSVTQTVDGKAEISVPGTDVPCYFLEIDTDSNGEETGEGYVCVSKAEWDKNRLGERWVDENGVEK